MRADFEDPFCVLRCAPLTAVRVHEPRVAIISFPRSVETSEHLDLNCVNITYQGDVRTFRPLKVGDQRHYVPSESRLRPLRVN